MLVGVIIKLLKTTLFYANILDRLLFKSRIQAFKSNFYSSNYGFASLMNRIPGTINNIDIFYNTSSDVLFNLD